ncbi:MAG: aspartate dehydrogenase [Pseudomonadota bacterium]
MPELKRVAIAGLGAIGGRVAKEIVEGNLPGLQLTAISVRDENKARAQIGPAGVGIQVIEPADLANDADIVVECLPSSEFESVAVPAIDNGRTLLVLSAGALLDRQYLIDRARKTGANILIPSGAMIGLDAVNAAAEGNILSVIITTRKPPESLVGAPILVEKNIHLGTLTEPMKIFDGSVREAIRYFPANVNVAAAVSLAGIGPDRTRIEVWADPTIERNIQSLKVECDSASFALSVQSIPSPENPRTGLMTPQSVIAALRKLSSSFSVGT